MFTATLRLATDNKAAPEGAQWDAPGTGIFLDTPAGTVTYDLGVVRSVSAFMLQADANDSYKVFGATENTPSSFKLLTEIESVVNVGHGLRTRPVRIDPTARALRPHRRAAGRRVVFDLRVPGLLPGAESVPAQARHASTRRRRR